MGKGLGSLVLEREPAGDLREAGVEAVEAGWAVAAAAALTPISKVLSAKVKWKKESWTGQ